MDSNNIDFKKSILKANEILISSTVIIFYNGFS